MNRTPYTFSVLRYVHDAVAQEFVNVGVVVYAPHARYLAAKCTNHYARAARLFGAVDGKAFRRVSGFVEKAINDLGDQISDGLPLLDSKIEAVIARVLPPDDSAMQFSQAGAGVSEDLAATLAKIFERHVERYQKAEGERRSEDDIWRTFRDPLAQRGVVQHLHPKKIVAPNYEYEFEHAWRNGRWHALEPISFDLAEEHNILEKAVRWRGRMASLEDPDAQDHVRLHVLLGAPHDNKLKQAFVKAKNLLNKMPGEHDFYVESEAERVADWFASQVQERIDA